MNLDFKNWRFNPFTETSNEVSITAEQHLIKYWEEFNLYGVQLNEGIFYENPSSVKINFATQKNDTEDIINGNKYIILSQQTLDFTTVGSADNNVGTIFTSTADATLGAGDSVLEYGIELTEIPRSQNPNASEYRADYDEDTFYRTGVIEFNVADDNKIVIIDYKGTGTQVKTNFREYQGSTIPTNVLITESLEVEKNVDILKNLNVSQDVKISQYLSFLNNIYVNKISNKMIDDNLSLLTADSIYRERKFEKVITNLSELIEILQKVDEEKCELKDNIEYIFIKDYTYDIALLMQGLGMSGSNSDTDWNNTALEDKNCTIDISKCTEMTGQSKNNVIFDFYNIGGGVKYGTIADKYQKFKNLSISGNSSTSNSSLIYSGFYGNNNYNSSIVDCVVNNRISGVGFYNSKNIYKCDSIHNKAGFYSCYFIKDSFADSNLITGFESSMYISNSLSTNNDYGIYNCRYVSPDCISIDNSLNFHTIYGDVPNSCVSVVGSTNDGYNIFHVFYDVTSSVGTAHEIQNFITNNRAVMVSSNTSSTAFNHSIGNNGSSTSISDIECYIYLDGSLSDGRVYIFFK